MTLAKPWYILQKLTLYILQKEIALYTASKVNTEFCWFDIDGDLDPLFKVIWLVFFVGNFQRLCFVFFKLLEDANTILCSEFMV